jgi:hypothetical protein
MSRNPSNFTDGALTITDDAGHSQTLQLSRGDQALTGLLPGGRGVGKSESRGHLVGLREIERAYPAFAVSGILHEPNAAFNLLAMGLTAGFVSTTADIGDVKSVDISWVFDYQGEARSVVLEDCVCTMDLKDGSPDSTVSYAFDVNGPVELNGEAVIATR